MVSQIGLGGARRNTQGVTLQELGEDLERQRKRHILHCFQTNLQTHSNYLRNGKSFQYVRCAVQPCLDW